MCCVSSLKGENDNKKSPGKNAAKKVKFCWFENQLGKEIEEIFV